MEYAVSVAVGPIVLASPPHRRTITAELSMLTARTPFGRRSQHRSFVTALRLRSYTATKAIIEALRCPGSDVSDSFVVSFKE